MNLFRRLYDWVLHWADSKWGAMALFIIAFVESSFFPIPPDVLLIALCLGVPKRSFTYAAIAAVGSVLGAIAGYGIGSALWLGNQGEYTQLALWFFDNVPGFTEEIYKSISSSYSEYGFWVVFTAGFTPIPFKVITITSGVFDINLLMFIVASLVSRSARFFLVAFLIWKFGPSIKVFIDKYFNLLALAFTVLLIGGFFLLKFVV